MRSWAPFSHWQFTSHKTKVCFKPLSAFFILESVGEGTVVNLRQVVKLHLPWRGGLEGMRLHSEARLRAACCNQTTEGSPNLSFNANPGGGFFQLHFMQEKAEAQSGEMPCWRKSGAEIDIILWFGIQKAYPQGKNSRPRLPLFHEGRLFHCYICLGSLDLCWN